MRVVIANTVVAVITDDGVVGIGSGSVAAVAAARALLKHTDLDPRGVAVEAMGIAGGMDIYTNDSLTIEEL